MRVVLDWFGTGDAANVRGGEAQHVLRRPGLTSASRERTVGALCAARLAAKPKPPNDDTRRSDEILDAAQFVRDGGGCFVAHSHERITTSHHDRARRIGSVAVFSLWAVAAACGGGDSATAPAPLPKTQPPPPDVPGLVAPRPLTISTTVETSAAVSKLIEAKTGGTIEAVSASGNRYTLVIPPNALLTDEKIKMIPLSAARSLPFTGGLAGGVKLEPEGLRFMAPAQLTISLKKPLAVSRQMTFGYHGDGAEFYLLPPRRDPAHIIIDVLHFSGAGVADGTEAEAAKHVTANPPTAGQDQYAQKMQQLIQAERAAQDANKPGDPQLQAKMQAILLAYYKEVVRPALLAAQSTDAAAEIGIPLGLGWMRQVQLMLGADALAAEQAAVMPLVLTAIENAGERAAKRCLTEHALGQFPRMVGIARNLALFGEEKKSNALLAKAEGCLTFELDFDSQFDFNETDWNWQYHVHSTVPVKFTDVLVGLTGEGPLTWKSYSGTGLAKLPLLDKPCTFTAAGADPDVFMVMKGFLDFTAGPTKAPGLYLIVDPGNPTDRVNASCPGLPASIQTHQSWRYWWEAHHRSESPSAARDGPFWIENWTASSPGVFRKVYVRANHEIGPCGTYSECIGEKTTIELRHKPPPG
ncbi:MAG: hypothetical protein NVS1B4_19950 [Gemmatimonadaceae bacterium]